MSDCMELLGLESIIFRYQAKGTVETPNGSIFICPLEGGALRFLHKIFHVRTNDRTSELENILNFRPPADYATFMSRCNGATLFDNALSIYGISSVMNRSLRLEDQQPISLVHELESAEARNGASYRWRSIGSVSGYELLFELEIDGSGRARMLPPGGLARHFESFREMVCALAIFLDGFVDENGFVDPSREGMDAALSDFVGVPGHIA